MSWLRTCVQLMTEQTRQRPVRRRFFWPQLEWLENRLPPAAHAILSTALPLSFAASPVAQVSGTLTTANQVDLYAVTLHQGDQLTVAVSAQQQGSSLQAALRLFNSNGAELPGIDSSNGGDPQLTFSVAGSGTYYIGISSSGDGTYDPTTGGNRIDGKSTGLYSLSVTDLLARFVNATPLNIAGQVQGTLTGGRLQDYSVTVTADTFLLATAVPESSPGFEPRLTLYDGTSRLLIQSDQHQPGLASATLEQHLRAGTYYLEVSAAASTSAAANHQAFQLTTALASSLPPSAPLRVGSAPLSAVVADLGNGRADLVTANLAASVVSVWLGNGDGTFQPAQSFDVGVGSGPDAVAVTDLGNGRADIVTANYFAGTVSVLLGNGAGSFTPDSISSPGLPPGTFYVGSEPEAVAVVDVNGDGHPDLVTANYGDNTVSVLLGNGAASFTPDPSSSPGLSPGTFSVGTEPAGVAVADLGNGRADIVTANYLAGTVSVLLGNGAGSFTPDSFSSPGLSPGTFSVGTEPAGVAVADLGNGQADIVTANSGSSTVSVLLGNGADSFTPDSFSSPGLSPGTFGVGTEPYAVAVADLGNGRADLVTANLGANTVSVLLGNGDGAFQTAQSFAVGSAPYAVAVADLGNGRADLVTANAGDNTLSVLLGNGDGSFQTAQSFAVGSAPYAVAVADLGNGRADIVTANFGANTVSVSLGNGDGTFQPAQSFAVGHAPEAVAVADLGNGRADIVTANSGDNTVSVLLGNGDGTFIVDPFSSPGLPPGTFDVGSEPEAVAVADLGNGRADLVTTDVGDHTVSVLLGNGAGSFTVDPFSSPNLPPGIFDVGRAPVAVAVADLGNGRADIVTANAGDNTVSVLLGKGDGSFTPDSFSSPELPPGTFDVGTQPEGVAVADLGNGRADIVTTNFGDSTVSVLLGNGDGSFTPDSFSSPGSSPGTFDVGSQPEGVAVADLGNGRADIVTANAGASTVSVLLGNGDGSFTPDSFSSPELSPGTFDVGSSPYAPAVADLGNGRADIVTANYGDNTVSVLLGNGDGTFQPAQSLAVGNGPGAVAGADLGNGHTDIVTTNIVANTVSVSLGNGDGTFQAAQSFDVGSAPDAVAVADVNGDGRPDIVTANEAANTVSVLLGNGDGTFQPAQAFAVGSGPSSVAVADLGNGRADIVTANYGDNTVSVLLGNGDGTFQPAQSFDVGSDPKSIAVTDLGNGRADIVTADYGDNTVSVLLGNSDGTFQPAQSFDVGSGPYAVAAADLGNGRADLVTANYGDNTVSVLLGNGDGTFQPVKSFAVGRLPHSVAVADLGNGHPDIVTANYGAGTSSVLLGNGDGTFHPALSFAVGSLPESVALADVNDDGRSDIVTANAGVNGTTSVLLNLGNAQFQAPTATSGIPSRDVPQLQDLTGDGIPGAVSLDQNTGQILFRQGTGEANNPYAPLVVVNPGRPATDFALVQTQGLPEIAALDSVDQQVILYAWSGSAGQFQEIGAFATGPQPVRIASADLGDSLAARKGLGDLVVGNDLDNTLTIALQQSPGTFDTFTRDVGAGPSSITFADMSGDGLLDIVVSDQVSGDVSVLFNDPSHSFTSQERYRAGEYPFDVNIGPEGTTLLTQLQTVGAVAGDFTGNGNTDLVALNANIHSFSLLRAAGGGSLIDPQVADTYLVGPGALQILAGDFTGDSRQDLAVLITQQDPSQATQPGTSQVWVFPNIGDGTFGDPIVSDAGVGATGFSFVPATAGQPDRFLVGDSYGDFLTLIPDSGRPPGAFTIARGNLDGEPLAVGTTAAGHTFVVLADQSQDLVQVFFQTGPNQLSAPVTIDSNSETSALSAPGAVQLVDLNKDPGMNPIQDLIVASRLGNDILVYQGQGDGSFRSPPISYSVGFEPTAFTVGDFNGKGGSDLAVANEGSNDISILLSTYDSNGIWNGFTYGPRLSSGGSEPIAVQAGDFTGRQGILDLSVTNAGGQIATLPGIGSNGQGTGFFQDNKPSTFNVPGTPLGGVSDGLLATTQGIFQIDLNTGTATQVFASADLTAISVGADGEVVAGFDNGSLGLFTRTGTGGLAESLIFRDAGLTDPSALEFLPSQSEIYATSAGQDRVFVFALSEGIAVPGFNTPFESREQLAELQPVSEAGLILVANIVTNPLGGNRITEVAFDEGSFGGGGLGVGGSNPAATFFTMIEVIDDDGATVNQRPLPDNWSASPLNDFILGVDEGLDDIRLQIREQRGGQGDGQQVPDFNDDGARGALDYYFRSLAGAGRESPIPAWQSGRPGREVAYTIQGDPYQEGSAGGGARAEASFAAVYGPGNMGWSEFASLQGRRDWLPPPWLSLLLLSFWTEPGKRRCQAQPPGSETAPAPRRRACKSR